jgi:transposase
MPFAALDLHARHIEAAVLDDAGNLVLRARIPTTREALTGFAQQHLSPRHAVAVEATFNTWPIVDLLTPLVGEVVVSNPLRTRAIAEAKIKTDKVDACVLAQLLRLDYLPRVWQPDARTQQLRRATTERAMLTSDRTRIKNRIHAILHQRLLACPLQDLFSQAGLDWLGRLELDPQGRAALDRQLRLFHQIESEIAGVTQALAEHAYVSPQAPQVKLLMTLPGVDFTVAQALLAALGDIERFPSADQAAAYLGLVPSTRQSGQHCYHGPITKQGRSHARWLMVQAAQQFGSHPGPLGVFFRRIARKKNRNVAVVATARKLVTIAWHMLRNQEPYRYAVPTTVQAKFDRLRIRATGRRRKGGSAQGTQRPASYGSGNLTRAVPSLAQIYAGNDLPPLAARRPGEQAMLERKDLTAFAGQISKPRRVPRKLAKKESS